jgi:hypothetical protein
MGRLGWQSGPDDVDPVALTAGLNGQTPAVLAALAESRAAGDDMTGLRTRIRTALEAHL